MFKRKKKNETKVFELHYDTVANYVFERLVDMGYAPTEDETLDMADMVFDFVLNLHVQMGGTTEFMGEEN